MPRWTSLFASVSQVEERRKDAAGNNTVHGKVIELLFLEPFHEEADTCIPGNKCSDDGYQQRGNAGAGSRFFEPGQDGSNRHGRNPDQKREFSCVPGFYPEEKCSADRGSGARYARGDGTSLSHPDPQGTLRINHLTLVFCPLGNVEKDTADDKQDADDKGLAEQPHEKLFSGKTDNAGGNP